MERIKAHIHFIVLGTIAVFWIFSFLYYHHWRKPERLFSYDVAEYYVYLPATFIYGDHDYHFLDSLGNPEFAEKTSIYMGQEGRRISKMNPGMAIMYSPFFLIAHGASLLGAGPLTGYSRIYAFWVALSGLVYGWLGLVVLFRILTRLFDRIAAVWTTAAIGFGTNLLYYATSEPAMAHAAGFFLMSCGILLTLKWHEEKKQRISVLLGFVIGMIILVRPVNIFFVLFPLLYGIRSDQHFLRSAIRKPNQLIGIASSGLVMLSLQLIFWKWKTGHFLYFSYQGEGFDFTDPELWNCLFSFRKGWLIYTPIMVFSLLGFFIRSKALKPFMPGIPIVLILVFYTMSSWWCWWYGGSFGFRPMIEWYALLAIPFAALVHALKGVKRFLLVMVFGLLLLLNIFQTHQYNYTTIHWDAMTWAAYKKVFLKRLPPMDIENYLDHPDYKRPDPER